MPTRSYASPRRIGRSQRAQMFIGSPRWAVGQGRAAGAGAGGRRCRGACLAATGAQGKESGRSPWATAPAGRSGRGAPADAPVDVSTAQVVLTDAARRTDTAGHTRPPWHGGQARGNQLTQGHRGSGRMPRSTAARASFAPHQTQAPPRSWSAVSPTGESARASSTVAARSSGVFVRSGCPVGFIATPRILGSAQPHPATAAMRGLPQDSSSPQTGLLVTLYDE